MTEQVPLDPFTMLKAIIRDRRFTHAEARFLLNHVLHTDNASRKVHHSIRATAEELEVDRKVGEKAVRKAQGLKYLSASKPYRNTRGQTVKDMWFRPFPPAPEGSVAPGDNEDRGSHEGSEAPPSTPLPMFYPCFEHGEVGCGCDRHQPPGDQPVEMCERHTSYPKASCYYCEAELSKPKSALPSWKQQDLYERQMAQEGLNRFGEPLGVDY